MGIVVVAALAAKAGGRPPSAITCDLTPNQIGGQRRQSIVTTLRPAILECHVLVRRCSRLRAGLRGARAIGNRPDRAMSSEVADHGHRLLRARGERPCCSRAAEQADEMTPVHGPIIAEFAFEGAFRPRQRCRKSASALRNLHQLELEARLQILDLGARQPHRRSSRGRDAGWRTGSRISPARPSRSTADCRCDEPWPDRRAARRDAPASSSRGRRQDRGSGGRCRARRDPPLRRRRTSSHARHRTRVSA